METRAIKFRIRREQKGDMIHFDLYGISNEYHKVFEKGEFITSVGGGMFIADCLKKNLPIMQYTGLKDKNGKEIREGDIVKSDKFNPVEVFYDKYTGVYQPFAFVGYPVKNYEVIGNVRENPDLIPNSGEDGNT